MPDRPHGGMLAKASAGSGYTLLSLVTLRWLLARLDDYSRWETAMSLQSYLPFLDSAWFAPLAIVVGFLLLQVAQGVYFQRSGVRKPLIDASGKEYRPFDWTWIKGSVIMLTVAAVVACSFALFWLSSYDPLPPNIALRVPQPPPWFFRKPIPESKPQSRPQHQVTLNAPGGFAISGGRVENPTVNNFERTPPRKIPDELRGAIVDALKQIPPGKIHIRSAIHTEAVAFAQDFRVIFESAGWQLDPNEIQFVMPNPTNVRTGVILEIPYGDGEIGQTIRVQGRLAQLMNLFEQVFSKLSLEYTDAVNPARLLDVPRLTIWTQE